MKIVFAFAFCALIIGARAQEGNNNCVWAAMNTYNGGGAPTDLEPAIKCSDEAIANESTSGKSKTWYYRGQLYSLIAKDTVLNKLYPTASVTAAEAFLKLRDLNDPKFKEWDDAANYIITLSINLFNDGLKSYREKNYALAFKQFYAVKQMNDVIAAKTKRKAVIENSSVLRNAAIAAKNAGDMDDAMKVYQEWIKTDDTIAYTEYVDALKKEGKIAEAKKMTDEGLARYPKDPSLLTEKVNFFLADSNYVGALGYVNNLIAIDPGNVSLYLVKGQAYDNIGKPDSMLAYYMKATEVAPKDSRAWINIGAYYVNSARPILEKMNSLGTSAEDNKKYDELKKQAKDLYLKAKPYLLKAHDLEPNNDNVTRTLQKVDALISE